MKANVIILTSGLGGFYLQRAMVGALVPRLFSISR
jgi:hypothetical protein